MTQETHLFKDTIANNIRIGKLDATDEEVVDACKKASTLSWKGEPLPYMPFVYQHPEYWQKIQEETI